MVGDGLFEELPEMAAPEKPRGGAPRLRQPMRDQIELRASDLDSLLGADHPARTIWDYVQQLELAELYEAIKAREGVAGHPPIDPRLLLALWLYATSQGVGSARALARLCTSEDAYRWLCGGVSVNYHTLSDFRVAHPQLWDDLLTQNVAALMAAGLIDLNKLAQDGLRVRAAAGASSFRRRNTLKQQLKEARALVRQLAEELHEDAGASSRRSQAARQRAARERLARVEQALGQMKKLEKERERRAKTNKEQTEKQKPPRASTTDREARVMKMADGGYRPAYNVQLAGTLQSQIIVGVGVDTTGSDRGLVRPMLKQINKRCGLWPSDYLVDGGFTKNDDLNWAFGLKGGGTKIYAAATKNKHGTDPYEPRERDKPGVADWRSRMGSQEGKTIYRQRPQIECINARARQWNIRQFTVRSKEKVGCVMRLFALANNILQGCRLKCEQEQRERLMCQAVPA